MKCQRWALRICRYVYVHIYLYVYLYNSTPIYYKIYIIYIREYEEFREMLYNAEWCGVAQCFCSASFQTSSCTQRPAPHPISLTLRGIKISTKHITTTTSKLYIPYIHTYINAHTYINLVISSLFSSLHLSFAFLQFILCILVFFIIYYINSILSLYQIWAAIFIHIDFFCSNWKSFMCICLRKKIKEIGRTR